MPNKILFVDDEAHLLQGLRRNLRDKRHDWDMQFVSGGAEALELLSRAPCAVIISDMRMPGMDGAEFLAQVKTKCPQSVRIVLSGEADLPSILRSLGPVHQYIAKPCEVKNLIQAVEHACMIYTQLSVPAVSSAIGGLSAMPCCATNYDELIAHISAAQPSLEAIAHTIAHDVGMSAKILQLTHSSFFGKAQHTVNPYHAATILGTDLLRDLVCSGHAIRRVTVPASTVLEKVNHTSLQVALRAQEQARLEGLNSELQQYAYTAGLLHQIGTQLLAALFPEQYGAVTSLMPRTTSELAHAQHAVFQSDFPAVGGHLLGMWGVPWPIVQAVTYQHQPELIAAETPDTVRLARILQQAQVLDERMT